MLLNDTMRGLAVDRAPVMPKIWLDLAANLMGRSFDDFSGNPEFGVQTVIEAAKKCDCDGARVFLFPHREVQQDEKGIRRQIVNGRAVGRIDTDGGWGTILDDPGYYDFDNPEWTISYQLFKCRKPLISDISEVSNYRVPSQEDYHRLYDSSVAAAKKSAGGALDLVGDCNSGTLAFCVSVLGMTNAMLAIYDDPELLHALMSKGIEISIQQAKFFIDHGIKILRYNDSVANMNVISPAAWREFVGPYIRHFCEEVHAYSKEAVIYCHICGNIMPIVYDLLNCGLDCLAPLDPMGGVSIEEIRKEVGDDVILMGGVNTLSFIDKTPEEICKEAEECIRQGFRSGRYVLGSGCVVPRSAPSENIKALAQASKNLKK